MKLTLASRKTNVRDLRKSIAAILGRTKLCSMATASGSSSPHINTAFFAVDENMTFFFISDRRSKHAKNLRINKRMAIAVYNSGQPWGSELKGIQLVGVAERASPAITRKADQHYRKRFPAYAEYIDSLPADERRRSPHVFFTFKPSEVKVIDEKAFGEEVFITATVKL